MENIQVRKPYGRLITDYREYLLLSPHPIPKDSWMNDGTYSFNVAVFDTELDKYVSCVLVVNGNFTLELDNHLQPIRVSYFVDVDELDDLLLSEEEFIQAHEYASSTPLWEIEDDIRFGPTEDLPFQEELDDSMEVDDED